MKWDENLKEVYQYNLIKCTIIHKSVNQSPEETLTQKENKQHMIDQLILNIHMTVPVRIILCILSHDCIIIFTMWQLIVE